MGGGGVCVEWCAVCCVVCVCGVCMCEVCVCVEDCVEECVLAPYRPAQLHGQLRLGLFFVCGKTCPSTAPATEAGAQLAPQPWRARPTRRKRLVARPTARRGSLSRWATASAPQFRHPISWASAVAAWSATFTLAIALGPASATHISVAVTQITNATRTHGIQYFSPSNEPCRPNGRAIPSPLWMIAQARVTRDAQTCLT